MDMKIKVCGMKYPSNISELATLSPDLMGFIFYPPSKRFVGLDFNRDDLNSIEKTIAKTGVFVNATIAEVIEFGKLYGMKYIQLHGNENPAFCLEILNAGFKVIKAFGIDDEFAFDDLLAYADVVDFFLFDTKTPAYGGSGKTFNWQVLDKYSLEKPFFLSGGLNPDNIDEVKNIRHKAFFGVDLNSGFEIEHAVKDIEKLKNTIEKIRLM